MNKKDILNRIEEWANQTRWNEPDEYGDLVVDHHNLMTLIKEIREQLDE